MALEILYFLQSHLNLKLIRVYKSQMQRNLYLEQTLKTIQQANYNTALVGIRPYRQGGIRLESEKIQSKSIIHNYGHQGSGVTLAPATAEEAVSLLVSTGADPAQKCVGVLGSGIVGLFTALFAARVGYKVKVYAQRIPEPRSTDCSRMCTSQIAPGYWFPYLLEANNNKQHKKRCLKSYIHYMALSKNYPQIIKPIDVYEQTRDYPIDCLPLFIRQFCEQGSLRIGALTEKVYKFKTLQINVRAFMQYMIKLCMKMGVVFVTAKFQTKRDVLKLEPNYLINCLGLGSRKIFHDKLMRPLKSYLVEYQNNGPLKWGIYGFSNKVKIYILPDRILATVFEILNEDDLSIDAVKVNKIKEGIYQFVQKAFPEIQSKL